MGTKVLVDYDELNEFLANLEEDLPENIKLEWNEPTGNNAPSIMLIKGKLNYVPDKSKSPQGQAMDSVDRVDVVWLELPEASK